MQCPGNRLVRIQQSKSCWAASSLDCTPAGAADSSAGHCRAGHHLLGWRRGGSGTAGPLWAHKGTPGWPGPHTAWSLQTSQWRPACTRHYHCHSVSAIPMSSLFDQLPHTWHNAPLVCHVQFDQVTFAHRNIVHADSHKPHTHKPQIRKNLRLQVCTLPHTYAAQLGGTPTEVAMCASQTVGRRLLLRMGVNA